MKSRKILIDARFEIVKTEYNTATCKVEYTVTEKGD